MIKFDLSFSFLSPAKAILVPGMYFLGFSSCHVIIGRMYQRLKEKEFIKGRRVPKSVSVAGGGWRVARRKTLGTPPDVAETHGDSMAAAQMPEQMLLCLELLTYSNRVSSFHSTPFLMLASVYE